MFMLTNHTPRSVMEKVYLLEFGLIWIQREFELLTQFESRNGGGVWWWEGVRSICVVLCDPGDPGVLCQCLSSGWPLSV